MNTNELGDVSRVLSRAELRRYRRHLRTTASDPIGQNRESEPLTRDDQRRIVTRAYAESESARRTITRVTETVDALQSALGVSRKAVYEFLRALGDHSLAVLEYCWHNEHASIRELTTLIGAATDTETLTVVRERLNVVARKTFGESVLEFERRGVDSRTGTVVTFEWWFTGEPRDHSALESLRDEKVVVS
ncbi:hypothetical protein HYG81_24955 (plasmid) [Natrinema zhouii]|uniref:hypothetical protein n=1 Tax=Natrinema zhouii TaxID=1710539 RepID=UPI001CFF690C|nr:hypothetical protein [Natrinema zhouii]UHQ99000.1 hypothetical protein HYG81_24955 [Natrinema zhouii]